jgi:leucyl aminopeptidase
MSLSLRKPPAGCTPIQLTDRAGSPAAMKALAPERAAWLRANGFDGAPDTFVLCPGEAGDVAEVWAGVAAAAAPFMLAGLPSQLPPGRYTLGQAGLVANDEAVAMAWAVGSYAFDAYKPRSRATAELLLAPSPAAQRGALLGEVINATRDLINTPAEHLGPEELSQAVRALAKSHGAKFTEVVGDALLKKGFPAVHAVGRAATRAPRLIELNWGSDKHPRLVLVGKGVCFDSGGLDIKPADSMRWMKKDMGGAAHAIALATLVMALKLPVRLQLLIPAVENAVAGNAFRPGDVFKTRQGLHIEIGNTDAEGRVILCDALAYGAEQRPDLMIDLATLTGAARVALGPALPALFCRDMSQARALVDLSLSLNDPLWHLPLWREYHRGIESAIADIVNTGPGPKGGAINAALFLDDFVPADVPWLHLDLYAWNDSARPGRPVGGEAQGLRTLLAMLEQRFAP